MDRREERCRVTGAVAAGVPRAYGFATLSINPATTYGVTDWVRNFPDDRVRIRGQICRRRKRGFSIR